VKAFGSPRQFAVIVEKQSTGAKVVFAVREREGDAVMDTAKLAAIGIKASVVRANPDDVPGLQRRTLRRRQPA
jgi:hypothetical protein